MFLLLMKFFGGDHTALQFLSQLIHSHSALVCLLPQLHLARQLLHWLQVVLGKRHWQPTYSDWKLRVCLRSHWFKWLDKRARLDQARESIHWKWTVGEKTELWKGVFDCCWSKESWWNSVLFCLLLFIQLDSSIVSNFHLTVQAASSLPDDTLSHDLSRNLVFLLHSSMSKTRMSTSSIIFQSVISFNDNHFKSTETTGMIIRDSPPLYSSYFIKKAVRK